MFRRRHWKRMLAYLTATTFLLTFIGLLVQHVRYTTRQKNELPSLSGMDEIMAGRSRKEMRNSTRKKGIVTIDKKEENKTVLTHPEPTEAGCMDLDHLDRDKALILGHRRKDKGFLTIGVTTAERKNASYLDQTLRAFIKNANDTERSQMRIVVFACDYHERGRKEALKVVAKYSEHIQSGLLQLIIAPRSFYPSFSNLKHTYDDSEERVQWRSKENIDSVFLFAYCAGMSDYFLQMDDDLEVSNPGYFQIIRSFINDRSGDNWVLLDIGSTGSGKLFRDEDVLPMARLLVQFYQEDPVDYLFAYFGALRIQKERFVVQPPLFKHLGVVSTLGLKNRMRQKKPANVAAIKANVAAMKANAAAAKSKAEAAQRAK
ncbi:alpha-1,3-mannosyl-glycoprotein 4-beta-N-acetylglucosaminyltransferase C-like [Acanthaster planci]|uniref:Alpha-1,3-mannosyl-glycoprotein 4-beta-N-acetylglucosaminyltransferase C-like n=1 Tax=Acanthaster planci TaxID=133434 RepID=A0A8B7Z7R8_ACAPL|nr:alpha-1,3-mannosyl-glycoprotein 4-beta-N-acetylglucosaminyltransferase C-like [Acanthaster planci]XP_022100850.1 alpha-1,3-mannosyl-glycoprotein 4-beta-N-acetylglucosaminyltransferase C-like [Acanthaster planci]